jgi:hypothetical protein
MSISGFLSDGFAELCRFSSRAAFTLGDFGNGFGGRGEAGAILSLAFARGVRGVLMTIRGPSLPPESGRSV